MKGEDHKTNGHGHTTIDLGPLLIIYAFAVVESPKIPFQ